jgi:hypothetical protein
MKEFTFKLDEFITYANQRERVLAGPYAQPRQTVDGVFEVEKDKSAFGAVQDELRNNPLLTVNFLIAVYAQPSNHREVTNNSQERPKHELTIEEAIVIVLLSFVELAVGILKAIDNKAKAYFLNQKGIFDGPGKRLLEKFLARRPSFHFLRPDKGVHQIVPPGRRHPHRREVCY